tara:strand:- start:64 stop:540 length:477 start_codon:yes stop_codon:yes gene_type:complete
MLGTKHLIQCHCVLPQFRKMEEPIFHKFVVYSKFLEDDKVEKKIVRCNNCDAVHRVIDLCKSEIVIKIEDTDVVVDEDEIKLGLPDKLVKILEKNNSDLPTLEAIDDIINSEAWGSEVVISRQSIDSEKTHLKILEIKGPDSFRLKTESIDILMEVQS